MIETFKNLRSFNSYYSIAGFLYALPVFSLVLFVATESKTEMLFWLIFLLGLGPCGLIGVILSILGLMKAFKEHHTRNKFLGIVSLLFGLGEMLGGVLGLALIYVVTS